MSDSVLGDVESRARFLSAGGGVALSKPVQNVASTECSMRFLLVDFRWYSAGWLPHRIPSRHRPLIDAWVSQILIDTAPMIAQPS